MRKATCSTRGCGKPVLARGLCRVHYAQERRQKAAPCRVTGCTAPTLARRLCSRHYQAESRSGGASALDRLLIAASALPEAELKVRVSPEANARLEALAGASGELPSRTARRLLMDALTTKKT